MQRKITLFFGQMKMCALFFVEKDCFALIISKIEAQKQQSAKRIF